MALVTPAASSRLGACTGALWRRLWPSGEVGGSGGSSSPSATGFVCILWFGCSNPSLALESKKFFSCLLDALEPVPSPLPLGGAFTRWMKLGEATMAAGGWVTTHPPSPVVMKGKGIAAELRRWLKTAPWSGFSCAAGVDDVEGLDCFSRDFFGFLFASCLDRVVISFSLGVLFANVGRRRCGLSGSFACVCVLVFSVFAYLI